jgi:homoserine kinase type II
MGTFRTLATQDVIEILSAFDPAMATRYRGHSPISAGTINTNVRVELEDGLVFLRVNEGKARPDVETEARVIEHVAARGVPTPVPLHTRAGDRCLAFADSFISLFPWVPGRTLSRAEVGASEARQAGRALAELHEAGADYPERPRGRYEPDEIERRFARVADLGDPGLDHAVSVLGPALVGLPRERVPGLPSGIIHGDLFIDNVLYGDEGRLTALLDFEQASWGTWAYDLAVTLLAFAFGRDDFRPDVTRALLEGYGERRRLTAVERAAFAAELRFAACRFAITRITDVYLRRGTGAPGGKDFGRYLLRLARVEEHVARGDGLLLPPA